MTDLIKDLEMKVERLGHEINFKNGLISILSHDSKEIFASFIWLIEAVEQKTISQEDFFNLLPQVKRDAKKNLQTVENTSEWLKTQYGRFEIKPVNIKVEDLFQSLQENHTSALNKKDIKFRLKADFNVSITTDRLLLEYILDKLLHNAIKYSSPGQDVYLQCAIQENKAIISIADSGTGISEKNVETVFSFDNPVYEGTEGERGAGLSLKIVNNFVSLLHGNIKIISSENKGTTVSIFLPQI